MGLKLQVLAMSKAQLEERLAKIKNMKGATASAAGEGGLTPAPAAGDQAKFLRGDGQWADVPQPGEATQQAAGLMSAADKQKLDASYTGAQVDEKVAAVAGSAYRPQGTKQTYADLPATGNKVGDVWNVVEAYTDPSSGKTYPAGTNYAYTEEGEWDPLGGEFDLTPFVRGVSLPGTTVPLTPEEGIVTLPAVSESGSGMMTPEQLADLTSAKQEIQNLKDSTPTDANFKALADRVTALENLLKDIPDGTTLLATTEA